MDKDHENLSKAQINPVLQQIDYPLDSTSQKIVRKYVTEAFPVGSIFISTLSDDPADSLGYGKWQLFGEGKTLVGLDSGDTDFDMAEETGGEKTHTLTTDEIPSHAHSVGSKTRATPSSGSTVYDATGVGNTGSVGGDQPHNNLQPYIVVYMWKRIS